MKKRILAMVLTLSLLSSGAVVAAEDAPNSRVLEHNLSTQGRWINVVNDRPSQAVKDKAEEICSGAKSDMEKLRRIYDWVTENIYYDHPWYDGADTTAGQDADDVLENRRGVCDGYSSLVEAMAIAVGIPCVESSGYAAWLYGDGWSEQVLDNPEPINHAWNEAWVDGRWVTLDATWGSGNKYYGQDQWEAGPATDVYFDPTPETFALDHKIARRGEYFDLPSQWAKEEIFEGMEEFLYPTNMVLDYQRKINRTDFSKLMIYIIEAHTDMTIEEFMAQKGIVPQDVFPDAHSPHIQAAYALGLVKGKVGEDKTTTKEEQRADEAERQAAYLAQLDDLVAQVMALDPTLNEEEVRAMLAQGGTAITDHTTATPSTGTGPTIKEQVWGELAPGSTQAAGTNLRFDPNGAITRQEAAMMLTNCATVLGITGGGELSFADNEDVAPWAAEAVAFVAALEDGGKAVMGDTGNGAFRPLDDYTSEQAQVSALRLLHCAAQTGQ